MYKDLNFHNNIDLSNLNFLVTGGAGFIGSHIAEYLLTHNAKSVKVLDNFLTGRRENIEYLKKFNNLEFIEGDIRDATTCKNACDGVDFVSHQAALGSVPRSIKNPLDTHNINVNGFLNMITAARDANVKRFVYASSSSVYGDSPILPKKEENIGMPLSPYAVTKYSNELYAHVFEKNYAIQTIGFRYFNVFGPRQDPNGPYAAVIPLFIDKLMNNQNPIIDGNGLQTRDFTFVQNVVEINIRAMFSEVAHCTDKVYNVAVGKNYSVLDLYNTLQTSLKTSFTPVFGEQRKGDILNSLADINAAKTYLKYNPQIDFNKGIELTIQYFTNNK